MLSAKGLKMNDSLVALGKRIQKQRRKAGLTQEKLAEMAELSLKHLGELERGRGNPSFSSIESVARALGISVQEMFGYENKHPPAAKMRTEIHQMIDTANDEKCRLVYKILKALFE
jgi:transcriptional regulator with XRE-family HTH domain